MADYVQSGATIMPISGDPIRRNCERIEHYKHAPVSPGSAENVAAIAGELKQTMTRSCGVFRDKARLCRALDKIMALKARYRNARIMDKSDRFNTDLLAAIETEHLLTFSEVIVTSALAREESRGAHARTDFAQRDDSNWLYHTLAHKTNPTGPKLSYKQVNIDWEKYPPQERTY
jgi:succinate dehydrogenase/fumarate reductase flavoprotein subunit